MHRIHLSSAAFVLLVAGTAAADYDPSLSAFYQIQEGTRNERVAVGSDGNILRWGATGGDEQRWLLVPVGDDLYNIRTKSNGEYMAVGSNGNVLRWAPTGGKEQTFRLVRMGDGRYRLREQTRDECVAVGGNGNVLRWACNQGNEQKFKLLPEPVGTKPAARPAEAEPGQIGDIPRVQDFGEPPPERSAPKLIGEAVIPAVYVDEPGLDKFDQIHADPYYILKREQFWDRGRERGAYLEHDGHVPRTVKVATKVGMKRTATDSFESTFGIKVSINAGFNYAGQSADIGTEMTNSLKVSSTTTSESMEERSHEETLTFPQGERFVRVVWSLVDRYELLRMDRTPVESVAPWEIVSNTVIMDGYPRE